MVHPSSPSILALISSFSPQVYSTWVHMAYFSLPSAHKTPSGPRAVGSWVLCLNPLPSGLPKPHFCSSFRSRDAFMSSIFKSHPNFLSPTWVLFFRILVNIWIYITYLLAYLSGYRHMHMHTYISMQINNRGTDINRNPLPFLLEYKFLKERWEFAVLFTLVSPDQEQYLIQYMLHKCLMIAYRKTTGCFKMPSFFLNFYFIGV